VDCLAFYNYKFVPGTEATCAPSSVKILGYSTMLLRYTFGPTQEPRLAEELVAPALNWQMLQKTLLNKGQTYFKTVAVKIVEGTPPDDVFHVPHDAVVTPFSVYQTKLAETRGIPICATCNRSDLDHLYNTVPPAY
jgi:hypothetical protein